MSSREPDRILEGRSSPAFAEALKTVKENPRGRFSFLLNSWEHVILGPQSETINRDMARSVDTFYTGEYIHAVLMR